MEYHLKRGQVGVTAGRLVENTRLARDARHSFSGLSARIVLWHSRGRFGGCEQIPYGISFMY
jgi:hypothetical protein